MCGIIIRHSLINQKMNHVDRANIAIYINFVFGESLFSPPVKMSFFFHHCQTWQLPQVKSSSTQLNHLVSYQVID